MKTAVYLAKTCYTANFYTLDQIICRYKDMGRYGKSASPEEETLHSHYFFFTG